MRLQLISDLHLEFDPNYLPKNNGSDTLILSGDICVVDYFKRSEQSPHYVKKLSFLKFFEHVAKNWDNVVYVMGNHENYLGSIGKSYNILKENIPESIHLLDKTSIEIDGIAFIGGTLWTDQNNGCPSTEFVLRNRMNDYRVIDSGIRYGRLSTKETRVEHANTLREFSRLYHETTLPVVVCSHHAPTWLSIHENYKNEHLLNGGYASDLSDFILDRPRIKLWTHGHMHNNFDYMVGDTRVVCNPKGYHNENPEFNEALILEIPTS